MSLNTKLQTYFRLGPSNLLRVACYRGALRFGIHPVQRLKTLPLKGPFYRTAEQRNEGSQIPGQGNPNWRNNGVLFGFHRFCINSKAPDWFINQLNQSKFPSVEQPWWTLADFDPRVGDIKGVWELSRFDWVLALAQQARLGDSSSLIRLNEWLEDWIDTNPPYCGPNWKCGQEASIRVLHLLLAAVFLGDDTRPLPGLIALIENHLRRISPTVSYAVGQCNNHATTEASALYAGGLWLEKLGIVSAKKWYHQGRHWLEDRARKLIETDGTFSQYSVNYHRLMLDAYSLAELWRVKADDKPLSEESRNRLAAATNWLSDLTQSDSGAVPIMGSNDGANLLPLTAADYGDFRPCVELAARLWLGESIFPDNALCDEHCDWLQVPKPAKSRSPQNPEEFGSSCGSGFATGRLGGFFVLLRYPYFRFRPSQADLMHLDVWLDGVNILRDAGTYSYNCDPAIAQQFSSMKAHNTVEFDGRDPMPRISRFLYGKWPWSNPAAPSWTKAENSYEFTVGYRDYLNANHIRRVNLNGQSLSVHDSVSDFERSAVLRWRLQPGEYQLTVDENRSGVECIGAWGKLSASSTSSFRRAELVTGWESKYYGHKSELPVLELEISEPGELNTTVSPRVS